jgi:hypothetical protein
VRENAVGYPVDHTHIDPSPEKLSEDVEVVTKRIAGRLVTFTELKRSEMDEILR